MYSLKNDKIKTIFVWENHHFSFRFFFYNILVVAFILGYIFFGILS
jgi:hypothetical protein